MIKFEGKIGLENEREEDDPPLPKLKQTWEQKLHPVVLVWFTVAHSQ